MNQWQKLSARERTLAATVVVLLVVGLAAIFVHGAVVRVQELDDMIAQRQESLIKYRKLVARSQSVDEEYAQVAAQHSSKWTGAEIHDRLRNEIYRLAMKDPPPVGTPFSPNLGESLVSIPTLRQGALKKGGEGYREYQLPLRLPGALVENMVTFLERLQASRQSLRIDRLQLARAPGQPSVTAMLEVTRTVVDGAPKLPEGEVSPYLPGTRYAAVRAAGTVQEDWQAQGCEVTQVAEHATQGPDCLKARASEPGATLFLREELAPETEYDVYLDVTAFGPGELGVVRGSDEAPYEGAQELVSDGKARQYRLRFTTPPAPDNEVLVPFVTLGEAGAEVYIDNVLLRRTVG